MAEKQTEGVINTQPETQTPPIHALEHQDITKNENQNQESATVYTQPQLANFIQEENVDPRNAPRGEHKPQIVHERDPPIAIPLQNLTDAPTWIDCPFCKKRAMTKISKEGSSMQMVMGFVLCLCCICLACLPCVCGWFETTHIYCTSCDRRIATIPVDGPIQLAPV
ncbi:hypothetical protein F4805DRAFT_442595, partial [Annulohypoxylon moriforme]